MNVVLRGEEVTLRPLAGDDAERLAAAVSDPSVRRWWGFTGDDLERVRDGFHNDGSAFAIEVGGELAGWLGFEEENEPDYRHAALDVMLMPPFQRRGLGPDALRAAIRWLISERGHHRFTIDPAVANERAVRAYAAVGFRPVGVMRRYDRAPSGEWEDALLMDLLAEELR